MGGAEIRGSCTEQAREAAAYGGTQKILKHDFRIISLHIPTNLTISSNRNLENPATRVHGPVPRKCGLGANQHVSRMVWEERI